MVVLVVLLTRMIHVWCGFGVSDDVFRFPLQCAVCDETWKDLRLEGVALRTLPCCGVHLCDPCLRQTVSHSADTVNCVKCRGAVDLVVAAGRRHHRRK